MNEVPIDWVFTHEEAREVLKISARTIRRLVKDGILKEIRVGQRPNPRKPGTLTHGSPRIPAESIKHYIAQAANDEYDSQRTEVGAQLNGGKAKWRQSPNDRTVSSDGRKSKSPMGTTLDNLLESRMKKA